MGNANDVNASFCLVLDLLAAVPPAERAQAKRLQLPRDEAVAVTMQAAAQVPLSPHFDVINQLLIHRPSLSIYVIGYICILSVESPLLRKA